MAQQDGAAVMREFQQRAAVECAAMQRASKFVQRGCTPNAQPLHRSDAAKAFGWYLPRAAVADSATVIQGGAIHINATHVTKRFNPRVASRIPTYFLEKLALCRLASARMPCAGRCDYFPRLLAWDDAAYTLVMSNAGSPVAIDADERKRPLVPLLADFRAQLLCMRQQLVRASVVSHDLQCKQLLVRERRDGGADLTLHDFDRSLVLPTRGKIDLGLSCPCPAGSPRARVGRHSSLNETLWARLGSAASRFGGGCFRPASSQMTPARPTGPPSQPRPPEPLRSALARERAWLARAARARASRRKNR